MGIKSHQEPSGAVVGVDVKLVDRALLALLRHHESPSSKEHLLGNDLDVQVQFTLVRVPGNAGPRPVRIDIPHPLANVSSSSSKGDDYDDSLRDVEACIIVKDASKEWVQEMIARFPSHLGCIKKVLTLQSLRIKHKTYDQRRLLLGRFDVFFADDRIVPMLSKALGTKFFDKKKQPIPVRLSREEALPFAIQRCLKSTYMYLSSGTCLTVRAGNTSMSPSKLLENIMSVCSEVPTKVPRKWSNVRSVSIKTTNSVALPIYNKTPEELAHIARLARGGGEQDRAGEEEMGEDMDGDDGVDEKRGRAKAAVGAADTPLARALKKQRAVKAVADGREEGSSEKKKRKGPTGETIAAEIASDAAQKSSKKEMKGRSTEDGEEAVGATTAEAGTKKTPKSSKRVKTGANDDAEEEKAEVAAKEAPKSSKKKKRKGAIDGDVGEGGSDAAAPKEEVAAKAAQGQKSAKKVKRGEGATTEGSSSSSTSKKEAPKEEVAPKAAQEQKSAKKVKRGEGGTTQESPSLSSSTTKEEAKNEDFVDAKKFNGAKRGYVFRKGPSGIGYYRDVLPVVDKSGLAGLLAKTTGGGNRKSLGGNAMKRKKGGNSRRSY